MLLMLQRYGKESNWNRTKRPLKGMRGAFVSATKLIDCERVKIGFGEVAEIVYF